MPLTASISCRIARPFADHGHGSRTCTSVLRGRPSTSSDSARPECATSSSSFPSDMIGVVGGQELGEHVAAAGRAGEDDVAGRRRREQVAQRRLGALDAQAVAVGDLLDHARLVDRHEQPAAAVRRRQLADEQEQHRLGRDLVARARRPATPARPGCRSARPGRRPRPCTRPAVSSSARAVSRCGGIGDESMNAFSATISTPSSPISDGITSDAADMP